MSYVFQKDFNCRDEVEFALAISHISLASERMKQLLEVLLELSRIGRKVEPGRKEFIR
jgi:hypothetical protein